MSQSFNEEYRFGSARWAEEPDLRASGLLASGGQQVAFLGEKPLFLDGDAPLITVGGAGSGKLRDLLAYALCCSPGQRMAVLDPRGELGAVSTVAHARHQEHAYFWNAVGMPWLPHHRCNPLDILRLDNPHFHADCKFIVEGLIALTGSANGRYFEQRARDWLENLTKSRVEQNGRTSLPDVHRIVNVVESDTAKWAAQLEAMLNSSFESVRRTASEMLAKQENAPKEFGATMGELYTHLGFLDDPGLAHSLEEPDFSLEVLCDPTRVSKVFLNIPAEYLNIWSPVVRLFFTVIMLYKARHPDRDRVMLIVDEAGQLGRFDALLRAFTYGRGAGIRPWAIFQDAGQIVRHYGQPALQSFLGSAQLRQFFGVRDYQTAQLVSDMLGSETLEYDDPLQQDAARRYKHQAVQRIFAGEDPFVAANDYAHFTRSAGHRTKQTRSLMTPGEVLAMPEDRQVLFISGRNLPPVYANKYPYFERREMAGLYLPNPYHPPLDRVPIRTRFRNTWAPVVTEPVPDAFAAFPQYGSGTWSYVKGYRPH